MTLQDLKEQIEMLIETHGEEVLRMEVMSEYDYGDNCHTRALESSSELRVITPKNTAYSSTGLAIDSWDDWDDDEDSQDVDRVIALIS